VSRRRARRGFIYVLENHCKLIEKIKGQSRQEGYSKRRIVKLLEKRPQTAKEISKLIKIENNTTRRMLYELETNKKVKRIKKVKVDQKHYAIIWGPSK